MFDKELFYALCNQYGVELSDKSDKPMLKTDDGIRELVVAGCERPSSSVSGYCFL